MSTETDNRVGGTGPPENDHELDVRKPAEKSVERPR